MTKMIKWAIRGAVIMGVIGLIGGLLGPSPINIFAPIVSITFLPLKLVLSGGLYGTSFGYVGAVVISTVWNAIIGFLVGFLIAKWRNK